MIGKDFYISTGIAITLYDKQTAVVASSREYTPYCAQIRQRGECTERCVESNLLHIKEAERTGGTVYYMCHGGNMEVITPVIYENTVIAYLQIGQFHDENGEYSDSSYPKRVAGAFGFDCAELEALYKRVPTVSAAKLSALENILGVIVRSFWEDGLISCKRSMLSVRVENYIGEHLSDKICVEELMREFSLSRNGLYKLFREEFGMSVNEYIIERRMELAERLLSTTEMPVSQVAATVGFYDYNYFIRVFKKKTGVSPLRFRRNDVCPKGK